MDEPHRAGISTAELLKASWQVWRSRAGMFVLLMGIPVVTILVMALIVNYLIAPIWRVLRCGRSGLGWAFCRDSACSFCFWELLPWNTEPWRRRPSPHRRFGADAVSESCRRSDAVRRKQLRLFWMMMLTSICTGLGIDSVPADC